MRPLLFWALLATPGIPHRGPPHPGDCERFSSWPAESFFGKTWFETLWKTAAPRRLQMGVGFCCGVWGTWRKIETWGIVLNGENGHLPLTAPPKPPRPAEASRPEVLVHPGRLYCAVPQARALVHPDPGQGIGAPGPGPGHWCTRTQARALVHPDPGQGIGAPGPRPGHWCTRRALVHPDPGQGIGSEVQRVEIRP
eukprot:gene15189-biopygen636